MDLRKTSKAAVLVRYHQPLEIREVPIPPVVDGAIIVKVDAATICGTDVHQWHGQYDGIFTFPPMIQGHELIGRILARGAGREHDVAGRKLEDGDRIAWTYAWCGDCYYCRIAHQPTLCSQPVMYGWQSCTSFPHLTGGYSEYAYVLPKCDVVKLPDAVPSPLAAAATCSLRTAIHGIERLGGISTAEWVVVQGAGAVGLWSTILAATGGAGAVITIGAPASRLETARAWGATHTIDIEQVPDPTTRQQIVMDWTGGRGADVVIEAAGVPSALMEGFGLVRKGGRVAVMGLLGNVSETAIPSGIIANKALNVVGVYSGHARHYFRAMEFLSANQHRFPLERLLSNRYKLEQATEALQAMAQMRESKPVIVST